MTDTTKLTAQERKALEQVLKRREREANESAGEVKAQRLAAFEEELAHEFSAEDAAFKDVTRSPTNSSRKRTPRSTAAATSSVFAVRSARS